MDVNKLKAMIGNKIYDLRMDHGLTQLEFSNKLGIYTARGHISKIESGLIMPSAEFIRSVCIAFNLSADWLLDINNTQNNIPPQNVFLQKFNNLDKEAQQTILNLMDIILKNS